MGIEIIPYLFAALTVIFTLLYQLSPLFKKKPLLSKMISSSCFVLTGVTAAIKSGNSVFSYCMLAALFLCLLGDFFLDFKNGKTFLTGVLFFSLGHLTYISSFLKILTPSLMPHFRYMVILFFGVIVCAVLHIKMDKISFPGKYKIMYLYSLLLIISFVVSATRGFVAAMNGNHSFGICLMLGGALFMVSDAFLGSQLFGKPKAKNTGLWVAVTYFPAQALFALSILFQ
ncbi:MAG: lysoplasmalogenase [Clostridia bacterium]|nr:lysoplasmalogenase [Clostridia bacterium]